MINARAETIDEKSSFRSAFKKRRCVVPASGFYEWQKSPGGKKPFYIIRTDNKLMSFAGLYEHWESEGGQKINSFTIITTRANQAMGSLHDRMPALLFQDEISEWLNPDNQNTSSLKDLLQPAPNDAIGFYPVSKKVNSPKNQDSDLIEEVNHDGDLFS